MSFARLVTSCVLVGSLLVAASATAVRSEDELEPVDRSALQEDLTVMARLLQEGISAKSFEISNGATLGAIARLNLGIDADPSATKYFYDDFLRFTERHAATMQCRADYLEGYGACFTMDVPVALELVPVEGTEEAPESNEDSAGHRWEEIERELRGEVQGEDEPEADLGRFALTRGILTAGGAAQRYRPDSLEALRDSVVDVLLQYGGRMALGDGEWIAVSIELKRGTAPSAGATDTPLNDVPAGSARFPAAPCGTCADGHRRLCNGGSASLPAPADPHGDPSPSACSLGRHRRVRGQGRGPLARRAGEARARRSARIGCFHHWVRAGQRLEPMPPEHSMSATSVVITHALRTPIGKYLGSLADLSAAELGVHAVQALLGRAQLDAEDVDELIFGNGRQAGGGPNVARQILCKSGIRESATAYTVNMACASGLKSIQLAAESIRRGDARVAVAGGTESMSRLPFFLEGFRRGYRLGHSPVVDAMYRDGFDCPMAGKPMGGTAETLAQRYDIPRSEQDHYAVESQRRCEAARSAGRFQDEIAPITIATRKGEFTLDHDEHPRDGVTVEGMAKLPPVFAKDGSVHAGNSSGITDGAAALLLMSAEEAVRRGVEPLASVGPFTAVGVDPSVMGIGPVPAIRLLGERTGRTLDDYDLIELNEAFAAQVLACDRELSLPRDRLNVNGGAIALGHPIGCTGAPHRGHLAARIAPPRGAPGVGHALCQRWSRSRARTDPRRMTPTPR